MPIFLLFIAYFFLEGYTIVFVWRAFGFINLLFALLVSAVLGVGILRAQGRYMIMKAQQSLARGQAPADEIVRGILSFVAGVLFLIPGFASDVIALFFILPGFRSLAVRAFKRRIGNLMRVGNFQVFTHDARGAGRSQGYEPRAADESMRDVSPRVIDVTPISVESHEKKLDDV